jgi:hypothetical protein
MVARAWCFSTINESGAARETWKAPTMSDFWTHLLHGNHRQSLDRIDGFIAQRQLREKTDDDRILFAKLPERPRYRIAASSG